MIQRRVFVTGKVQGVGFRQSVYHEAKQFRNLRGFVRNLADGRVEAVFSGDENEVLHLAAWCKVGPARAKVTQLEVIEERVDPGLPHFEIAHI